MMNLLLLRLLIFRVPDVPFLYKFEVGNCQKKIRPLVIEIDVL